MRSKHWLALTATLVLALVAAILLLLPSSPVSVFPQQEEAPKSETVAQESTDSESEQETLQTPASPVDEDAPTGTTTPSEEEQSGEAPAEAEPDPETADDETLPEPPQGQDTADLEDLLKATRDPDWKTRWDAVNALGNMGDPRAIPVLVERALYDDNSHPRWRSLWALSAVGIEGSEAVPLLLAALETEDPVVRRNAAVALAFFSQPEAIPELLAGLGDPDEFRRWEAVFSLRDIGDAEVAGALAVLLDETTEPADRVRGEAALTLGRIGGDEVVPALLNAVQNDRSPQVRWRAASALSRLGDASLVTQLEQALTAEEDPQVREFIEDAIDQLMER